MIDKQFLKDLITRTIGKESALEDVITLESIGMSVFPRTTIGKVAKNELLEAAEKFYLQQS